MATVGCNPRERHLFKMLRTGRDWNHPAFVALQDREARRQSARRDIRSMLTLAIDGQPADATAGLRKLLDLPA